MRSWLYPLPWQDTEVQAEGLLFPNWILGGKSLIYQNRRQEARQLANWYPERPEPCQDYPAVFIGKSLSVAPGP